MVLNLHRRQSSLSVRVFKMENEAATYINKTEIQIRSVKERRLAIDWFGCFSYALGVIALIGQFLIVLQLEFL